MTHSVEIQLLKRRYREVLATDLSPSFDAYLSHGRDATACAALGYRRAGNDRLFLERYLDTSIELAVSNALRRPVRRGTIVEIGNFAAENAMSMVALWGATANDLGDNSEVAVATLTAPLRGMFARIGIPICLLAPARIERAGDEQNQWGRYYELDPWVCAGLIAEGQSAIVAFKNRRAKRIAA
jgi:hypothetical protein